MRDGNEIFVASKNSPETIKIHQNLSIKKSDSSDKNEQSFLIINSKKCDIIDKDFISHLSHFC